MARRQKNDDDAGAMDSLLDTMTNVVGILVIVLVVTQLGVGDAVQRISETMDVDEEDIAKRRTELVSLDQKMKTLETFEPQDDTAINEQLRKVQAELDENSLKLKNIRNVNRLAANQMALAKKEAEDAKAKRKKLESDITNSLEEVASLRAKLDQTPERVVPPAHKLRLPNPREAPEGAAQLALICANDRVYPMAFGEIQKAAREKAEKLLKSKRRHLIPDQAKGIDRDRFIEEFTRRPLRNDYFDVKMTAGNDGYPKLVLHPKENGGARHKDLKNKKSKFHQDFRQIDPEKFYIRFFVTSDNYETYMMAREIAESYGLACGWVPQPEDWKFIANMGGDIRFGNPPPPPKAAAGAKPPPKKNNNVID